VTYIKRREETLDVEKGIAAISVVSPEAAREERIARIERALAAVLVTTHGIFMTTEELEFVSDVAPELLGDS
jgi:hypothetical protein